MKAINIDWDIDADEDLDFLPNEIQIPNGMTDTDEISDYITDKTGFCHFGFELAERKMNEEEKKNIENKIRMIMQGAISGEYARYILDHKSEETESTFIEDVIDDLICSSAWSEEGYYNDDDIRLSIGRIFMERMGVEA